MVVTFANREVNNNLQKSKKVMCNILTKNIGLG